MRHVLVCFFSGGGSRGRVRIPPAPIRPSACLRTEILTSKGSYITFQLADFVMKRTLHFATKLNFRDIKKCNCFLVPSYDLFASAHKAVFPALTTTGVHRLRKTWSSLLSQLITKKVQQAFLNQSLTPPGRNQKFLDPLLPPLVKMSFR